MQQSRNEQRNVKAVALGIDPIGSAQRERFVVATPQRSVCDENARVLEREGLLRLLALGTRHGVAGVSHEHTSLNPAIGLMAYTAARILSPARSEAFRFRLLPWFDSWVCRQLKPGDHIISSYGYVNRGFAFVRRHGGKTFVDAGNSHIENLWEVLAEEHRRWKCSYPPIPSFWYQRAREMLAEKPDFILSPSSYVTKSFLARGYKPGQILRNVYPVDLSTFRPSDVQRPQMRPLTVINTGSLSLRKGTPYLLEAFRLLNQRHPSSRLLLTEVIQDDVKDLLHNYRDLPIQWSGMLPHAKLAERLRSADVFVLPSLEDGWARTVCEALACGLPVVVTPNTGACDMVTPGVSGELVPIRDSAALVEGILKCYERTRAGHRFDASEITRSLSFDTFASDFIGQLRALGFVSTT